MGRRPKPTELKRRQGTLRKDRVNPHEPKPAAGQLVAPSWMSKSAAAEYERLAPLLSELRLLGETDVDALAMLADAITDFRKLSKVLERKGRTYRRRTASGGLIYTARPEVALREKAWQRVLRGLSEFGMTPASRTKASARPASSDDTADFLFGPRVVR